MTTRTATCSCGQLRLACEGEPVRISICHCLECQKRTGSIFGAMDAAWRQRRFGDVSFLPDLRLDGLLGAQRPAGFRLGRDGGVCRSAFSATQCLGL